MTKGENKPLSLPPGLGELKPGDDGPPASDADSESEAKSGGNGAVVNGELPLGGEDDVTPTGHSLPTAPGSIAPNQPQSKRIGKYELLASIGVGGMAEVFLARNVGPMGFEKVLVLKRILPHLSAERHFVDMFLDEARLAARITHPNVVDVYELGQENGIYFLAMEYLHGESLAQILRAGAASSKPLHPGVAARIVADAAAGLHAAHELQDATGTMLEVVHRDVSPANIVVLYDGRSKVVDFGVAKALGKISKTTGDEVKGKFAYMSPEQVSAEPIDRRSDIFSLGTVLWEALAQRRLFKAESEAATVRLILDGDPPSPKMFRPKVPDQLAQIALKALRPKPRERFSTAADLRDALEAYLRTCDPPVRYAEVAEHMQNLFRHRAEARKKLIRKSQERAPDAALLRFDPEGTGSSASVDYSSSMQEVHRALLRKASWRRRSGPIAAAIAVLAAVLGVVVIYLLAGPGERGVVTAKPAVAPPSTASARVDFAPVDAVVELDGERMETTSPALLSGLKPGTYSVTVSAPGFKAATVELAVKAGDAAAETITLEPLAASTLTVATKPTNTTVELDGVLVGITPFTASDVRPEVEHLLRLSRDGYEPLEERFVPKPGETVEVTRSLVRAAADATRATGAVKAKPGKLYLNATPWATIYYGKRKLGETPLLGVELPAGKIRLTAVNEAKGLKKSFSVKITPGGTTRENIKL